MEASGPRIRQQAGLHLWVFHDARGPLPHGKAGLVPRSSRASEWVPRLTGLEGHCSPNVVCSAAGPRSGRNLRFSLTFRRPHKYDSPLGRHFPQTFLLITRVRGGRFNDERNLNFTSSELQLR